MPATGPQVHGAPPAISTHNPHRFGGSTIKSSRAARRGAIPPKTTVCRTVTAAPRGATIRAHPAKTEKESRARSRTKRQSPPWIKAEDLVDGTLEPQPARLSRRHGAGLPGTSPSKSYFKTVHRKTESLRSAEPYQNPSHPPSESTVGRVGRSRVHCLRRPEVAEG